MPHPLYPPLLKRRGGRRDSEEASPLQTSLDKMSMEVVEVRNKPKWCSILLVGLVFLLISSIVGCAPNPRYVYENGAIHVGADGEPIELINNPDATNPTYAELVAFIKEDSTDEHLYSYGYVCSDFAEAVHNNAEAAGIRVAWVGIDLEGEDEGHACNAFETTDRGLVYIDCTGGGLGSRIRSLLTQSPSQSWDTVAYVEIGKEYGLIDIAKAESLSYSFYEEYKQKWQEYEKLLSDYNEEVMRYNQEVRGKVYHEGSPEDIRITLWEIRLDAAEQVIDELGEELSDYWFELPGIIKDIHIHW
jgi:hypothetical protein